MTTDPRKVSQLEWPDPKQYRRSLRWQFSLYLGVLVILLMAVAGYEFTRQHVKEVTSNVVNRILVQARSHSVSAAKDILSPNGPDVLLLNNICRELSTTNRDLYWAAITDETGTFLAHTDMRQLTAARHLNIPAAPTDAAESDTSSQVYVAHDTLFVYVPIKERELTVGHLALASSTKPIIDARMQSIVTVASATLVIMLVGIPLILWMAGRKLQPIATIVSHLQKIDPGDLTIDVPVQGKNELAYLAATLKMMGTHLRNAQEERMQAERMVRELEIAREIQIGILPKAYPKGPQFEFYGSYTSAMEVGGDYYDFLSFDNGKLGFLIADVSGKSLPGMLVMLMTRDILRGVARGDRDPRNVLCDLNRELLGTIRKGMFVTMSYGLLDPLTGRVAVASAGHNPLIWISESHGEPVLVRPKGYPLGLMEPKVFDQRVENQELILSPNDWLVQFTDGVNEARDPLGTEYGMDRLVQALHQKRALKPSDYISQVLAEHSSFVAKAPQHDDITLVAMKWFGERATNSPQEIESYAASR